MQQRFGHFDVAQGSRDVQSCITILIHNHMIITQEKYQGKLILAQHIQIDWQWIIIIMQHVFFYQDSETHFSSYVHWNFEGTKCTDDTGVIVLGNQMQSSLSVL